MNFVLHSNNVLCIERFFQDASGWMYYCMLGTRKNMFPDSGPIPVGPLQCLQAFKFRRTSCHPNRGNYNPKILPSIRSKTLVNKTMIIY